MSFTMSKERNIPLTIECVMCNTMHIIMVSEEGYTKRKQGALIQNAYPDLTPAERELIVSGTCGKCYDVMINGVGDDEDDELNEDGEVIYKKQFNH